MNAVALFVPSEPNVNSKESLPYLQAPALNETFLLSRVGEAFNLDYAVSCNYTAYIYRLRIDELQLWKFILLIEYTTDLVLSLTPMHSLLLSTSFIISDTRE